MRHGAIDSPTRLLDWFEAKGYRNIVFRVADLRQLTNKRLATVVRILNRMGGERVDRDDTDDTVAIRALCPTGYAVLSIAGLRGKLESAEIDMGDLVDLQDAALMYRILRQEQGYPSARRMPCGCGKKPGCRSCDGTGDVLVIDELSAEEKALAEGA